MKIFLASLENAETEELLKTVKIRNGFYSFFYLKENSDKIKELMNSRSRVETIVIDSGAHTFFSESENIKSACGHKKQKKTKQNPEEYFNQYVKWIETYWSFFDYFVELDIGEIVSYKRVLEWREELKKRNLYSKCITVYHPACMTWEDLIKTLEDSESKYLGVEGYRVGAKKQVPYLKVIKECYDRQIKVHGFAMNKISVLERYPFYSVDSSSWKSGERYGSLKIVTEKGIKNSRLNNLKIIKNIKNKNLLLQVMKRQPRKLSERMIMRKLSIEAYNNIEDYFTKYWINKGVRWK